MSGEVISQPEWMTGKKARSRLNVTMAGLYKLAARGLIEVKAEPGEHVRYKSADVNRLAQERERHE